MGRGFPNPDGPVGLRRIMKPVHMSRPGKFFGEGISQKIPGITSVVGKLIYPGIPA